MHVFVTGGTGRAGPYIISDLIAAGHEVTALARSDAAAVSALGAKVRHGSLEDLEGLQQAAAAADGVIHVAHRQDAGPWVGNPPNPDSSPIWTTATTSLPLELVRRGERLDGRRTPSGAGERIRIEQGDLP